MYEVEGGGILNELKERKQNVLFASYNNVANAAKSMQIIEQEMKMACVWGEGSAGAAIHMYTAAQLAVH